MKPSIAPSIAIAIALLTGCSEPSNSDDSPLRGKWVSARGDDTLEFLPPNLFKYHKQLPVGELYVGRSDISGEYKVIDDTHLRLDVYGGHPEIVSYILSGTLSLPLPPNGPPTTYTRVR